MLNFISKKDPKPPTPPLTDKEDSPEHKNSSQDPELPNVAPDSRLEPRSNGLSTSLPAEDMPTTNTNAQSTVKPISIGAAKPKNVFAAVPKKNAFAEPKKSVVTSERPMSAAERIMKEEMERKRQLEMRQNNGGFKRQRVA